MSDNQIIRPRCIPAITGLSRSTIWRLEQKGLFPSRIKLSPGCVGYRSSEVAAWLESRQAVVEV